MVLVVEFSDKAPAFHSCPLYTSRVPAGFPSPADDHAESLNLLEFLVTKPHATFFAYADGDSMIGRSINHGDLLIVDRSKAPTHGAIVVASINGEMTCKVLFIAEGKVELRPANPRYPAIKADSETALEIVGVVAHTIHTFK